MFKIKHTGKIFLFAALLIPFSGSLHAVSMPGIQPLNEDLQPIEQEVVTDFADLSLDAAIQRALQANRDIVSARQEVEKAEGKVLQAKSIASPKLSGKHSQTRLDDVGEINFGGQSLAMGKKDIAKSYVELNQPLYLGGKAKSATSIARLGRSIARSALILEQQSIVMKTTLEYLGWVYAREVELVGKKDLELAQAHHDLVQARFENNMASRYELLRADVRLAQAKSIFIKHQNSTRLAQLQLMNSLVLPLDNKLQTSYHLEMDEFVPNLDEGLKIAQELREDLFIQKQQKTIADRSVNAAFAERRPDLVLFGQFGSEDPSSKSSMGAYERKNYWNAGVSLNFPILDGGLSKGKIKEAKASLKQSENNCKNAEEKVELEVKSSALSLLSAAEIVTAQKENLKQAEETLRLARVRYENGMFTQVEMFDAENAYSNSRLTYLAAVFDYHQAKVSYLMATGQLGRNFLNGNKMEKQK